MDDQKCCKREEMLIEVIRDMFYILNSHCKVCDMSEERLSHTTHGFLREVQRQNYYFSLTN